MPTKMAWLSFLRTNQILTLRTKLRNAAIIKKYLLLTFIFFLGGGGFKLHERFVICESVSGMATPRTTSQGMVVAVPEEGWPIDVGSQPSTHPIPARGFQPRSRPQICTSGGLFSRSGYSPADSTHTPSFFTGHFDLQPHVGC